MPGCRGFGLLHRHLPKLSLYAAESDRVLRNLCLQLGYFNHEGRYLRLTAHRLRLELRCKCSVQPRLKVVCELVQPAQLPDGPAMILDLVRTEGSTSTSDPDKGRPVLL